MAKIFTKHTGVWKEIPKPWVRTGTTWKEVKNAWVKVNGVWKLIYEGALVVTNNSTVANYNLFAQAGSPSGAVNVVFVNNGIIYGTSTSTAALKMTGFGAGSTIYFDNNNFIYGKGGNGGNGSDGLGNGSNGGNGGTAIEINSPVSIDNSTGWIYGGGGGGGGGGGAFYDHSSVFDDDCMSSTRARGGGGGGGQSYSTTSGGVGYVNGSSGNVTGAGSGATVPGITIRYKWKDEKSRLCYDSGNDFFINGGKGGNGGSWGQAGAAGATGVKSGYLGAGIDNRITIYAPDPPGAAGRAITRNGQTITWIAGSNRVSGAIV